MGQKTDENIDYRSEIDKWINKNRSASYGDYIDASKLPELIALVEKETKEEFRPKMEEAIKDPADICVSCYWNRQMCVKCSPNKKICKNYKEIK